MSIRNKLQEREEQRNKAAQGSSINDGLPEGVTRYVRLGQELKDGKTFVLLADPDNWFFYYTHEDSVYAGGRTQNYFRKHTCLHSPRKVGEDFDKFSKPNKSVCLSCAAKAKRKLYFMVPVFDPEYGTWRILDLKEFHASNLIGDFDKLEKAAKKFSKDYTLVGDAVTVGKTTDGKSYSMSSAELDESVLTEAAKFLTEALDYEELAYFREEDDIAKILSEAADEAKLDKSVLGDVTHPDEEPTPISDEDAPPEVNF